MKRLFLLAMVFVASCSNNPEQQRELTQFKGAEVLEKDTIFFKVFTLKLTNGDIIYTGYYPKDAHYKAGDTIK